MQKIKQNLLILLKKYSKLIKEKIRTNDKIRDFITEALEMVAKDGINKTLKKKKIQEIYNKHCG